MSDTAHPRTSHKSLSVAVAAHPLTAADRTRFAQLLATWRDETKYLSASTRIKAHPSYRAMVSMGPSVVPLLLAALQDGEWLLHTALVELTGEDPVPSAATGHASQVIATWTAWGRTQGLG